MDDILLQFLIISPVVLVGPAFLSGFLLGKYYIKSMVDLEADKERPEWIKEAIEAYRMSPKRPLRAEEIEEIDWEKRENASEQPDE